MQEILLLLLLAALLFGAKKLPSIGRSAGKGLRELKEPFDEVKAAVAAEDVKKIRKVAALTTNPKKALTRAIFDNPEEAPKPVPDEVRTET
ncbi:MAG: twin-arginine translocase TatA/TatE family subunit [Actinomycetota bacterium]|nr:twin-arginine translocase TatA/TatE family subunit [Actinomycetota bacterium]